MWLPCLSLGGKYEMARELGACKFGMQNCKTIYPSTSVHRRRKSQSHNPLKKNNNNKPDEKYTCNI